MIMRKKITSAVIGRNVRTAEEREKERITVFQRKGDTGTTSKGSEHAEKYPHGEETETASVSVANSNMQDVCAACVSMLMCVYECRGENTVRVTEPKLRTGGTNNFQSSSSSSSLKPICPVSLVANEWENCFGTNVPCVSVGQKSFNSQVCCFLQCISGKKNKLFLFFSLCLFNKRRTGKDKVGKSLISQMLPTSPILLCVLYILSPLGSPDLQFSSRHLKNSLTAQSLIPFQVSRHASFRCV